MVARVKLHRRENAPRQPPPSPYPPHFLNRTCNLFQSVERCRPIAACREMCGHASGNGNRGTEEVAGGLFEERKAFSGNHLRPHPAVPSPLAVFRAATTVPGRDVYLPMPLFETVTDLAEGAETLLRRRFGVIEVADGDFQRVVLRPFPKIVSAPGIRLLGAWHHRHRRGDCLRLYFNQPRRFSNFLVLKYIESAGDTSMATLTRSLAILDEIARQKRSDALLCDAANWRITERLLGRWGWEPHCPSRFHRHFIKRFYGVYPTPPAWLAES